MIFISIKVDYNNPGNPIILVILVQTLYRFPPATKIAAKKHKEDVSHKETQKGTRNQKNNLPLCLRAFVAGPNPKRVKEKYF
jgi:hypothetical protein